MIGHGLEPTREEPRTRLDSNGRHLTLTSNIRLGWNWKGVEDTLAYFETSTITAVKSLKVTEPNVNKKITAVFYECLSKARALGGK
jgi:hypothetical protein